MSKRPASPTFAPSFDEPSDVKKAKLILSPSLPPSESSVCLHRLYPSPACPGIVKTRPLVCLERLPPESDAFAAFAKLRADKNLSDEEAFLELLTRYDLPLVTLSRISSEKLDVSFSNTTYKQVAPYVWLNPSAAGGDMLKLDIFRSRIPNYLFKEILADLNLAEKQYGPMLAHDNEEARSRFLSSLFNRLVSLFGSAIINKPEGLLESSFSKRGRIEHHFISMGSISIVFVEMKKELRTGKAHLDVIGQVLAECAACDFTNQREGHWAPVLALLCDGANFEFFVMDSADKVIFTSGWREGLLVQPENKSRFLLSVKRTTERLFDWFIMAYINGIRSLQHLSTRRSEIKKRRSTDQWSIALSCAEDALCHLRQADKYAEEQVWEKAESMAKIGVEQLKESVSQLPSGVLVNEELTDGCDWPICLEESLAREFGNGCYAMALR